MRFAVLFLVILLTGCLTTPTPPAGGNGSTPQPNNVTVPVVTPPLLRHDGPCRTLGGTVARDRVTLASDGEHVFAFGGSGTEGTYTDEIAQLAPSGGAPRVVAHMASARVGVGVVWTGERFLLFGGFAEIFKPNGGGRTVATIESWVPGDITTHVLPVALSPPRGNAAVVWDGARAWIMGGDSGSANLDQVDRFDPETGRIMTLSVRMPTARSLIDAVWTGETFYLLGGHQNDARKSDEIVRYSPAESRMGVVGHLGAPVAGGAAVLEGRARIAYLGGTVQDRQGREIGVTDATWVFDLATGTVTPGPTLPHARGTLGFVTTPSGIILAGGLGSSGIEASIDECTIA